MHILPQFKKKKNKKQKTLYHANSNQKKTGVTIFYQTK